MMETANESGADVVAPSLGPMARVDVTESSAYVYLGDDMVLELDEHDLADRGHEEEDEERPVPNAEDLARRQRLFSRANSISLVTAARQGSLWAQRKLNKMRLARQRQGRAHLQRRVRRNLLCAHRVTRRAGGPRRHYSSSPGKSGSSGDPAPARGGRSAADAARDGGAP